jgi:hypothetical protein
MLVAPSYRSLQSQINTLSSMFHRPITGIHNRTNGLFLDVLEILTSHRLPFTTKVSIAVYAHLRDAILNPSTRIAIVLAHGTGVSHVLDKLHADLPTDILRKLEIYMFGSSATHLSNHASRSMNPLTIQEPRFTFHERKNRAHNPACRALRIPN